MKSTCGLFRRSKLTSLSITVIRHDPFKDYSADQHEVTGNDRRENQYRT